MAVNFTRKASGGAAAAAVPDHPAQRWFDLLNDLPKRAASRWVKGDVFDAEKLAALVLVSEAAFNKLAKTYIFSGEVAESLARNGLPASTVADIVKAADVDLEVFGGFIGLNRTTIKRRADKGDRLSPEASAKTLEFAELATLGTEVFGTIEAATRWLTRRHPLLDNETPLDRAKTRWGFDQVKSLLVAVRYGTAA